jgi:surface protein
MKKCIRIISLFFIFISLFFIGKVNAATNDIKIDSISVKETFGSIEVEEPLLDGNNLTSKITFNEEDDYVIFKLTLKNVSEEKYRIISIQDNNSNDNISVEYDYNENYIESGNTKNITIKLKYRNQLMDIEKISLNDLTIRFNLEKENGKQSDVIINPLTHDALLRYLGLLVLTIIGLLILVITKNKKKIGVGTLVVLLATTLIPFAAIANEKYTVDLKFTNIDIMGKFQHPSDYSILLKGTNFRTKISNDLTAFRKATEEEYNTVKSSLTDNNIISTEDSPAITYLWKIGNTGVYYSEAETVYMNEDSSYMFDDSKLTSIDLSGLDSSRTINMSSMFKNCNDLQEVNLSNLNTKNVTNMSYMFYECNELEQLDLLKFDTEKVTNMSEMFTDCYSLIVLDLSSFDTRNLENADYMFVGCVSLQTIYVSNGWVDRSIRVGEDFSNPVEFPDCLSSTECEGNEIADSMFAGCYNLVGEMGTSYDDRGSLHYDSAYARVDRGPYKRGFLTLKGTMDIAIFIEGSDFNNKLLALNTEGKSFRHATEEEYNAIKDNLTEDNIVSLSKMTPIYMWETSNSIIYYSEAEYIYFNPDSSYMFANSSLVNVDVSEIGGFLAEDMSYMFYQNEYLSNINFGDNTGETNNSGSAMNSNNIVAADVLSATNNSKLIILIPILIIIIGAGIYAIFKVTKINKNSVAFGVIIVTFVVASLAIVFGTFGLNKLLAYVGPENGKIDATPGHFSTEKVANMDSMFEGCSSLVELDLSIFKANGRILFEDLHDSYVTSIYSMFKDCTKLETIYVSSLWDNNVSYGSGWSSGFTGDDVFVNCYELVGEKGTAYIDPHYEDYVSDAVYARVDGGTYQTAGYFTLKGHTKEIIREATLKPGRDLLTGSVVRRATKEEYLEANDNLSESNIASTDESDTPVYMWQNNDGDALYYSKAETIYFNADLSDMFRYSNYESISITGIDTSRVEVMSNMFEDSQAYEIDLSSFDTSNVIDMGYMFVGCNNLETIYVSDKWDSSKALNSYNASYVFEGAYRLSGEKGTLYDENNVGISYAHIDGGSSNPGYLTETGHTKTSTMISEDYFSIRLYNLTDGGKYFRKATEEEYNDAKESLTSENIVSISQSKSTAVYIWQSGDDVLYYSKAETIYMPVDSSGMFSNMDFISIDLSGLDSSKVTNMSEMFRDNTHLTSIDLSMLDTSNVTDMSGMFYYDMELTSVNFGTTLGNSGSASLTNNKLSADVLSITDGNNPNVIAIIIPIIFVIIAVGIYTIIKTKKIKKYEMTIGVLTIIVAVSSIVIFIGAFGLNKLKASVNQDNENGVESSSLFNTSNVTTMNDMFFQCESLTELDLSVFDVSSLQTADYMFAYARSLETIYVSGDWVTDSHIFDESESVDYVSDMISGEEMFNACESLVGGKGTTYIANNYSSSGLARIDGGLTAPGYFTLVGHEKELPSIATLLDGSSFNGKIEEILGSFDGSDLYVEYGYSFRPATEEEYNSAKNSLTNDNVVSVPGGQKVYVWASGDDSVYYSDADTIYMNSDSSYMFDYTEFKKIDLSGFDSSLVTNMYYMFYSNYYVEEIDLSSFNMSNVEDAYNMFSYDNELKTVYVSDGWSLPADADNWTMFSECYSLVGGAGTEYVDGEVSYGSYAHIDGGVDNPGYFTDIRNKN